MPEDILFGQHNLYISMKRLWKNSGKVSSMQLNISYLRSGSVSFGYTSIPTKALLAENSQISREEALEHHTAELKKKNHIRGSVCLSEGI